MKRSTILLFSATGYLIIGIVIQLLSRDSQANLWPNLAAMAGDLPDNSVGFLFSIFYLLLTVLFWPLHLIVVLFS